jgi:dTDP-4-dehydrorhamnose 3,5-epimerase
VTVSVLETNRVAEIDGVLVHPLTPNVDLRGSLCEVHRDAWGIAPRPLQWDFITTRAGILRGVHVHRHRWDYLIMVQGAATLGLADLRRKSPSFRRCATIEADGERPVVVLVPPGVAHGIHARTELLYLYGLTSYYDGTDQMGCRFDDPALDIAWPTRNPVLLSRDAELPSFETLIRHFEDAGGVAEG